MKILLLYPWWFIELFTWAKSFRQNRLIGSRLLNRLGLHVARVVIAQLLFRWRLWLLSPLVSKDQRRQFRERGYIVVEDFLPQEEFAALRDEVHGYQGPIREIYEGDTITQRVMLTDAIWDRLPKTRQFAANGALAKLMRYASSKNRLPLFYFENLLQHRGQSERSDVQKDTHTDTFHPTTKGWLFLDEVTDENGPYTYVPGSHRLCWSRLKWEYQQSLIASRSEAERDKDRYWDGAFRVTDEDLASMGFDQIDVLYAKPNTLVIANTYGFHRRGEASGQGQRLSIWMQMRDNPFSPFVALFPRGSAKLVERVRAWLEQRNDQAKGGQKHRRYEGRFDTAG